METITGGMPLSIRDTLDKKDEIEDLRAQLAKANERVAYMSAWIEQHCMIDWIATHDLDKAVKGE